jgi:hypothetical protein
MGKSAASDFRLRQLKWQIEQSPDSEEFVISSGGQTPDWIINGEDAGTIQWQTMFDGGGADTPESAYLYFLSSYTGGDIKIRGIFDECVENDKERGATRRVPRVILFAVPAGIKRGVPVIIRGKEYKIEKQEIDANTGIVLRLN